MIEQRVQESRNKKIENFNSEYEISYLFLKGKDTVHEYFIATTAKKLICDIQHESKLFSKVCIYIL